jgi:alanyl-tRNA synthetase
VVSQRLDYDDAYTTRFRARVTAAGEHAGRPACELEATYFFPEGGGQEADRGRLGGVDVVDVQSDESGRVWHAVAEPVAPGADVDAEIDWQRRFDHMQQHTGQHVLSAAFEREAGAATVSSRLGAGRATIDVDLAEADWRTVERIERAANAVVWEDRPVERHWVDDEGVKRFALRKPPVFTGRIRIVEIPGWDVSACGGTHTRRTGEVGVIKIVRWEKVRGTIRFEFLCGGRALRDYAWRTETLLEAARRRTLGETELIEHLERAAAERDALRRQLRDLAERALRAEARERVGAPPAAVEEFRDSWPRDDVRRFTQLCLEAGSPRVVAGAAGPEAVLMVATPRGAGSDLRALLPELLEAARGKGGGSPDFLQISAADAGAAREAFRRVVARTAGGAAGS